MKFDSYTLKARIFPFFILILPLISFLAVFISLSITFINSIPIYFSSCIMVIIAIFVRNKGKNIEPKLWDRWDGAPTIRYMRYSNTEYNEANKRRCHAYFKQHLPSVNFPTQLSESKNSKKADDSYYACINHLRVKSRDKKKYPLIYAENIEYGFMRNSFGIKSIGIVFSLIILIVALFAGYLFWLSNRNISFPLVLPVLVSICTFFYWTIFISEKAVKIAAHNYAERLLEICLEE